MTKTPTQKLIKKWEKELEENHKRLTKSQKNSILNFLSDLRAALPEEEKRKKRLFEVLDEMNVEDGINKTSLVAVCPDFISADRVKRGTKVTMGVGYEVIDDMLSDKSMPVLLIIDKKEYFKRINPESK